MKTFLYSKDGETLVSQFFVDYEGKVNYAFIQYGIGDEGSDWIEFTDNLPTGEFNYMISAEGWKLKEVVTH